MFQSILSAVSVRVWLLFAALAGGVLGAGGFTFSYAQGLSYFSDDPAACKNCHVMREVFEAWSHGSHRAVAVCNDCHTPHDSFVAKYAVKGINGFNHSKAFTLADYPDPIRITAFNREVAQANCLVCHGEFTSAISHADARDPTDCLRCHSNVGHRTRK